MTLDRTGRSVRSVAWTVALGATLALSLGGCIPGLRPAPSPMPFVQPIAADRAPCLLVLLPGSFDRPAVFRKQGFLDDLEPWSDSLSVLTPDAHLTYYRRRSLIDRLDLDVFGPNLGTAGSEGGHVYSAGVSLGGLGSLLYASRGVVPLDGVVLLAPFLGDDEVIDEIRAAGGPLAWRPTEPIAEEDFARRLWSWLQTAHTAGTLPEIWLGWGTDDDLAPAAELLAELLPPERVFTRPGGHDWDVWRPLWRDILAAGALVECQEAGTLGVREPQGVPKASLDFQTDDPKD